MKRKHDLLKEKSKTRDAVGQISSWCLLIALHQRFGVGADRMERIAGKAEKLQKEIAAIIDEHGTAAGIAEMQRRLDGICLTEMRVPLNRNTKNRREVELRMAADQTVTAMWCCFALAIHQTLGFGRDRLNRLHKETVENYRQFNEWNAVAMTVVDNRTIYIFGNAATVGANHFLHKGHAPFKCQCPTRGPLAVRHL